MKKIDKILIRLSDLYEFNRKIKGYRLKKKKEKTKPIPPTLNTRG
ncbi:MAG: hypothetical protein AB1585_12935 [Thermodesulfobacteriota bacterium]